ncbi:MAG TPA: DUF1801 domain-containing protein [Ktedonobacterales bacterium]|jgi:hypothetical protein|nr:DUF1801 domain-containing protein [Ktedonobacterales bacterium]
MEETVDELFPTTPPAVRAILGELRRVVCDTLPDATEILYHGALGYGATASGFDRILYVMPQNGYANLGFFYGIDVPDPSGLLEGTGKRMRHIKIRSILAAQNPAIVPLVWAAWKRGGAAVLNSHEARKNRPAALPER